MKSRFQTTDGCTAASYMDKLSSGACAEEAERRNSKGQKQTYCAVCGLCRWPEEQRTCKRFTRSVELEEFHAKEITKSTSHRQRPGRRARR